MFQLACTFWAFAFSKFISLFSSSCLYQWSHGGAVLFTWRRCRVCYQEGVGGPWSWKLRPMRLQLVASSDIDGLAKLNLKGEGLRCGDFWNLWKLLSCASNYAKLGNIPSTDDFLSKYLLELEVLMGTMPRLIHWCMKSPQTFKREKNHCFLVKAGLPVATVDVAARNFQLWPKLEDEWKFSFAVASKSADISAPLRMLGQCRHSTRTLKLMSRHCRCIRWELHWISSRRFVQDPFAQLVKHSSGPVPMLQQERRIRSKLYIKEQHGSWKVQRLQKCRKPIGKDCQEMLRRGRKNLLNLSKI